MGKFKALRVRNDAMESAKRIYACSRSNTVFSQDFALSNHITGAAISVPSNIAEGDERGAAKEAVHFSHISKGAAAEVITQLNLAHRPGYPDSAP